MFAILFIASTTLLSWANAENVYKFGNTYNQAPCFDGTVQDVSSPRDAAQKKQADGTTIRDTQLAQSMTRERLAQELIGRQARSSKASGR